MRRPKIIDHVVLACTLTLLPIGTMAGIEGAQAMPVSTAVASAAAAASDVGALTAVQYMRYPNYRYRRFNRHRRAGLYRCGPGALSTHLERKACR